jgi:hypothetical protein
MNISALQSGDIGKIAAGSIVGLVVIGALLSLIITRVVGRIIVLALVVVLGLTVWNQRTTIENKVKRCDLNMSFLGVKVKVPPDIQAQCKQQIAKLSTASR